MSPCASTTASRCHLRESKSARTERYYTVGYPSHNGKPNPPSAINLKGRWLEECGFITGMPVTVTMERGRIIIETQINL
ncbi:SymE family type I addiction module toxin [Pectobacterium polonicum]|uniref:SymE family type I addiction module toxin n=1 Tax=Pectobacterium polonicum TaxID=2485124 RepID=UPI002B245D6A|nr:SymE family type I addiction module toxin [Pectobacterium polonicum]